VHPYATDSKERRLIPLLLGLLALGLGLLVHTLVLAAELDVPWWLDIPTPLVLYGLLWTGFDRFVWHWSACRRMNLTRVPDYRGKWFLKGTSDYGSATPFSGAVMIRQTWTSISVEVETNLSRSHSLAASVLLNPSAWPQLVYEYFNEPKAGTVGTLQAHRGTAWLKLTNDALEGEYYGGRGSGNAGSLRLTRE
jgi:hypothetical protein